MTTRIAIHQTYRLERWIVIEAEAGTYEAAAEMLASGEYDVPAFYHPDWAEVRALQHEDYRPA